MRVIAKRLGLTNDSERTQHNNVMHEKPDLRVFLKWMIADYGSVIADVIWLQGRANVNAKIQIAILRSFTFDRLGVFRRRFCVDRFTQE